MCVNLKACVLVARSVHGYLCSVSVCVCIQGYTKYVCLSLDISVYPSVYLFAIFTSSTSCAHVRLYDDPVQSAH